MGRRAVVEITDEQYQAALDAMADGATKKKACEILGINYNTKRLGDLIDEWLEKQEITRQLRKKKRSQPVTNEELASMITDYLSGSSLQDLSDSYYRSTGLIKHHLEKHGAMLRQQKTDPLRPELVPEQCMSDSFVKDQIVWSMAYNCPAKVCAEYKNAYRILILDVNSKFYAYQAAHELADLSHLEAIGVDTKMLSAFPYTQEEIVHSINKAVHAANKRK